MAGDAPAHVGRRDSGLAAEHGDDGAVDVGGGDAAGAKGEQQVGPLAGAPVGELRLAGADGLPRLDGLVSPAVEDVHGAGVCRR